MESLNFIFLLPGWMVGAFLLSRVFQLLMALMGIKYGMRPPPPMEPADEKKYLAMLALFAVLWLVTFGGVAYYFYGQVGSPGWAWFFSGVASACVIIPIALIATLRAIPK